MANEACNSYVMIDFVSFETIDLKTLKNASQVTAYIQTCGECLHPVNAFQMIYDGLKGRRNLSVLPQLARAVHDDAPAPGVMELLQTAAWEEEYGINRIAMKIKGVVSLCLTN